MLDIDFPRYPGEYSRDYNDDWEQVTELLPMGAQGRALEEKHGCLPALHMVNRWGTNPRNLPWNDELVLGVLRAELPTYPVGTPATEEMYALPPPKRRTTGNDW